MKKLAFLALAVVAAGCSTETGEDSRSVGGENVENVGVTKAQGLALQKLQLETRREWSVISHEKHRTPMHVEATRGKGVPQLVKGEDVSKTTVAFLAQYRDLFRMHDPAAELRATKSEVDELAMTHARFQQMAHGVPVVGAELAAHYDAAGRITSIDANYVGDLEHFDVQPSIDAKVSARAARADVVARTKDLVDESQLTSIDPKLVVFALGEGPARLAYEHRVRAVFGDEPAIWVVTIDAKSGEIIDRYNDLQTIEATSAGVAGTSKTFQVTQSGGGYVMTDASRGAQIRTYTAGNAQTAPGTAVTSGTLSSWDRTTTGAGAAVDAHVNAAAVYDYYKNKHARNAIDGAGGALVSTAHFGSQYDNAFWDPDRLQMAYGDGGSLFKPLSAGLDVCAHEFTHGVTSSTSDLRYQGQTGALNESVSDIFGVFIEHSVKADDAKNWMMGEDIARGNTGLRDFKNPASQQQPAHMSKYVNTQQDSGGVHTNSGIPNNAAYLMTVGGKNPVSQVEVKYGIGFDKSEKVWYRANTKYFLSTTNFAQAAAGTMSAAKDVALTDNEQNIVDCAWKATGVVTGACATNITDPAAVTPRGTPGSSGTTGTGTGPDGTTDGTGGDGTDGTDGSGSSSTKTPTKRTRQTLVSSDGCNVGAAGRPGNLGVAGLLAAALGLALGRRRKKG